MKRSISVLFLLLFCSGCEGLASKQKADQLAGVAKDWCLTIRASEVMPTYPLTEDVQPGDIFLVTRTIDQEVQDYTDEGFLPLSNMVARNVPVAATYDKYYSGRYGTGNNVPPGNWQFPTTQPPTTQPDFSPAPHAAFPSYTFSVKNGESLNLGIPIQSVPVGLALLNSSEAAGTVQLSDAYTYGLDLPELTKLVDAWEKSVEGQRVLSDVVKQYISSYDYIKSVRSHGGYLFGLFAPQVKPQFLRVVTRVYLVGGVSVSLSASASGGGSIEVGNVPPLDISQLGASQTAKPTTAPVDLTQAYSAVNTAIKNGLSPSGVGGSVSLIAASARSVSMDEHFPRPLVVGYLAYDLEIRPDGKLSAPSPTRSRILDAAPHISSDGTQKLASDPIYYEKAKTFALPKKLTPG